mgnify:CR=1 FL=1
MTYNSFQLFETCSFGGFHIQTNYQYDIITIKVIGWDYMKNFTLLFITIFLLGGCSSKDANENWYDSKEDAIKHGLKMEGVQNTNTLEEINIDGEIFLFL